MANFQRSELTDNLVRYMGSHDEGTVIPYQELSSFSGTPISSTSSHLQSAKKILLSDRGQCWWAVRNIGVKRLTPAEAAEKLGTAHLPSARRKLAHGDTVAKNVDVQRLDQDDYQRFQANSTQIAIGIVALSRKLNRGMEKVVRGTSNDMPAFNAADWRIILSPRRPAQD